MVPKTRGQRRTVWLAAVAVLVVLVLAVAGVVWVVTSGGAPPMFPNGLVPVVPVFDKNDRFFKDASVKEGIHNIEVGVRSYAVDNQDAYPVPSMVSQSGMAFHLDYWPRNPYTALPMTQGTGPGDFTYTLAADGGSFELVGYGEGGKGVITAP